MDGAIPHGPCTWCGAGRPASLTTGSPDVWCYTCETPYQAIFLSTSRRRPGLKGPAEPWKKKKKKQWG